MIAEYLTFTVTAFIVVARRTAARKYDVVQVHSPPDFLIMAALPARVRGARILLDVHDLSSDMFAMRFGEAPGASIADRLLRGVEWIATRLADHVVTVHEPYRSELIARGCPRDRVTVVMNSLDEKQLPPLVAPGTPREERFRVVYHGTITPPYGVLTLVEAAGALIVKIPHLTVEIIGEGDALEEAKLVSARLAADEVIRFSDRYLPHREVLARLQGTAVGVVPNLATRLNRFALSSKLLEYVALGIPVVSSDLPTIREHFSDDEVLFFEAGNPDALAAAILAVASDPNAAAQRAARATLRYREYAWSAQSARYAELIRSLARAPS